MKKQNEINIENKVSVANSVKLTLPCVVVWNEDLEIVIKTKSNIETSPGIGTYYQEFETESELEQFIVDSGLTDPMIID